MKPKQTVKRCNWILFRSKSDGSWKSCGKSSSHIDMSGHAYCPLHTRMMRLIGFGMRKLEK